MKKLVMLLALATMASSASFASDVVGHSAKTVGKDSAKVVAYSGKEVGKAGVSMVKVLF